MLLGCRAAAELVLEAFHATCRIHKALFPRVGRVAVGGDVADNHVVFLAFDGLLVRALHRRAREKFLACRNIDEADGVGDGMSFGFHDGNFLALAGFEARVAFANDVDAAVAPDHLAVRMARLERFKRG